jgi:hypothetical protein
MQTAGGLGAQRQCLDVLTAAATAAAAADACHISKMFTVYSSFTIT